MIIDVHTHLGYDYPFDKDNPEETFLYWCDRCKIDYAIVQPAIPRPYIEETAAIHDRIYNLCKKHNGRFFGMASISPHFIPENYEYELRRCIVNLGFVGVKILPISHAVNPASKGIWWIYELCQSLDIPVMVHTGAGAPFADPINLFEPAKQFKDIKFVMAHAGTDAMYATAIHVAKQCPNIYLEPSWLSVYFLEDAVRVLGTDRVMFSSDMPRNTPVELAKYNALSISESEREQLLYKTAKSVYNLNI